jgi:hypothetical protein
MTRAARVALFNLEQSTQQIFSEAFRQFGMETIALQNGDCTRVNDEKFEACALELYAPNADTMLSAIRSSPLNKRIIVFGVRRTRDDLLRTAQYAINVVLDDPLDRSACSRAVRASKTLVLHEFRRYVRIPIATEVTVLTSRKRYSTTSVEISEGGMSLQMPLESGIRDGDTLRVAFTLPQQPGINLWGKVCWSRAEDSVLGVRFEPPEQEERSVVKQWISDYLQL